MNIKTYVVGMLQTNCYIVSDKDTLDCVVIDPGAESGTILNHIDDNRLNLQAVFVTHGHSDHVSALEGTASGGKLDGKLVAQPNTTSTNLPLAQGRSEVKNENVPIYVHKADSAMLPYSQNVRYFGEGDVIDVGKLTFTVLSTPGHTPGSVCLMCKHADEAEAALFTGDTLFKDSCGRTDFDGGSMEQMMQSLLRLNRLNGDYEVYPGHNDTSTLDRERRHNYYMRVAVENADS